MSEIFFDTFTVSLQMFEAAAFRSQLGQVFEQIFGQVFDQIFDQGFDQGFWSPKYSVQFYWDREIQCTFLRGRKNTVLQFYWHGEIQCTGLLGQKIQKRSKKRL